MATVVFNPDDSQDFPRIKVAMSVRTKWIIAVSATTQVTVCLIIAALVYGWAQGANAPMVMLLLYVASTATTVLAIVATSFVRQASMRADHKTHQDRLCAVQRDVVEQWAALTAIADTIERLETNQTEIRDTGRALAGEAAGRAMLVEGALDVVTSALGRLGSEMRELSKSVSSERLDRMEAIIRALLEQPLAKANGQVVDPETADALRRVHMHIVRPDGDDAG